MLEERGKVIALGSLAVLLLSGAAYEVVIPHIPSLCPTLNNCARDKQFGKLYRTAVTTADSGLEQTGQYQNLLELKESRHRLMSAIDQLATILEDVNIYPKAEQVLGEYRNKLQEVDKRLEIEKQASANFTAGQKLAEGASNEVEIAKTIGHYQSVKADLEKAKAKLEQIPADSIITSQVQPLKAEYQTRIKTIEGQIAQLRANLIHIYWSNQDHWMAKMPEKSVALTFDDGPVPQHTNKVLDILKKHRVKGTFFVIGRNVDNFCPTLQRIVREGHEVANHSYSHNSLPKLSPQFQKAEMEKTQKAIQKCVGTKHLPLWFRSPYGAQNTTTLKVAHGVGLNTALWTIDTLDWRYGNNADYVANKALQSQGQDIILFHDHGSAGLERIIMGLKNRGIQFVTLSEALP